jgi:hypothetical protein
MIHVVVMKCLTDLPLLIHIELLWRSRSRRFCVPNPQPCFSAFYATQRFITAFTSARHLSQSWVISIQYMAPYQNSLRCIFILPSHQRLGLPSRPFPSDIPVRTLYAALLSAIRVTCNAISFIWQLHKTFKHNMCVNEVGFNVKWCGVYITTVL